MGGGAVWSTGFQSSIPSFSRALIKLRQFKCARKIVAVPSLIKHLQIFVGACLIADVEPQLCPIVSRA